MYSYFRCIVYEKLLKLRQSFRITLCIHIFVKHFGMANIKKKNRCFVLFATCFSKLFSKICEKRLLVSSCLSVRLSA